MNPKTVLTSSSAIGTDVRGDVAVTDEKDDEGTPPLCEKYGVWQEKSMYGKKYMGVVRTTYLIAPGGKVLQRWDKVKVPGHAEEVLAAIQEAQNNG